jgi:leader peptidase (prepilin peptidase)/N-methyltransferase
MRGLIARGWGCGLTAPLALYLGSMLTALAFELPAFLLGLLFGSFLNVCISRLPAHQSISKPRSNCPHCLATIRWYDNIPLLSWILLRARCRNCKQPISWRYPAVELAFGLWLAYNASTSLVLFTPGIVTNALAGHIIGAIALAILGFLLIGLIVMDWQTHKLPDAFTLTGTVLAFVLICARAVFLGPHEGEILLHGRNPLTSPGNVTDRGNVILTGPEHLVLGRLLAIVAAAGILLLIRFAYQQLRHREGLGLGDVKLIAMIAAFLGFWPAILALFLGSILCSAYALTLMLRRRADALTRLPLGTFLSIGGLVAALIGTPLIAWYTTLL